MDELMTRRHYDALLQTALDDAMQAPGVHGLAALRAALRGDRRRPGFDDALAAALAQRIDEAIASGLSRAELARALGVTTARVTQLRTQDAVGRAYRERRAAGQGPLRAHDDRSPEQRQADAQAAARERARVRREADRAEAARLGTPWLARLEGGEPLVALAAEAGVTRQRLSALVRAARAVRDAEQPTT